MKVEYVEGSRPGGGAFYEVIAEGRTIATRVKVEPLAYCSHCGHYVRDLCRPEAINECPELRHVLTVAA